MPGFQLYFLLLDSYIKNLNNMNKNIKGIEITPLKIISDDRGSVMHMLRNDNKIWHSKNTSYKPKGYIGFLGKQKNRIEKNIKFGEQSYTFNNIEKFKDFYFLYD